MKRKIYDALLTWKANDSYRTSLLIDGARRVGKSYIVKKFAKEEYKSYILIDFNKVNNQVKSLFENYLDNLDNFFLYLSAYFGVKLYRRKSLIIFDEVQLFPRARAAIKYLVEDGRYDYIETGTLVSIKANVTDIVIPSEEHHIKMNPMDFEEFLWANGNETLMPLIRQNFNNLQCMGSALHRKAMDYFRQYLIVGGMPQVVNEYVNNKNFANVDATKRDILSLYRQDIIKHAHGYERKVEAIFDKIPSQLQKHKKRFNLASIDKKARFRDYKDAIFYLDDAMIANMCFNSQAVTTGLRMNCNLLTMKCYMADTGLLVSHTFDENLIVSEEIYKKLLLGKLEFNEGMIVENVVAQMLTASGHKLYFYSNSNRTDAQQRMEIDFLISKQKITSRHNISPLEVKSSKNYTLSSLQKFRKVFTQQLHTPYVLHSGDLMEKDGVIYLPLYMIPLL